MLDQNTDRMWYVIGAVIIGAAIILIFNGTVPQIFASVVDTFMDKTDEVTTEIDNMGNMIDWDVHTVYYDQYPHDDTGVMTDNPSNWWNSTVGDIEVEGNMTYSFASPDGMISPRVAYYNEAGEYLGQDNLSSNAGVYLHTHMDVRTPANTAFVRIAAGDIRIDTASQKSGSPVEDWEFKRAYGI